MDTSTVYSLIKFFMEYIKPSDKEEALFASLDILMEEDIDLSELKSLAEDDEEDWIAKCIGKYIKENELDEEEDEEW